MATHQRPQRTKNRKSVTYSDEWVRDCTTYRINSKPSGIFTPILSRIIDQLDICALKWGRVLVIRFDLHQPDYTSHNKLISQFRKNLCRRIEREYSIGEIGYVWVREQERGKSQHYHFAIFLDGNKVRHSSKVLRIIKDTWETINPNNHVPVIRHPYHFVNDKQSKLDAVYRLSYLAKTRGKGYRDIQAKDYSTSRIPSPLTPQLMAVICYLSILKRRYGS